MYAQSSAYDPQSESQPHLFPGSADIPRSWGVLEWDYKIDNDSAVSAEISVIKCTKLESYGFSSSHI